MNNKINFDLEEGWDIYYNSISGIWNSYGCIPEDGNNLTFYLEENTNGDASLINLCGFDTEKRQIGVLADNKNISELVVMIPMLEKDVQFSIETEEKQPIAAVDPCAPCDENLDPCGDKDTISEDPKHLLYPYLVYNRTEDAWLFVILNDEINNKINEIMYDLTADSMAGRALASIRKRSMEQIKQIVLEKIQLGEISLANTIWRQVYYMLTYNIPPHLNWLLDHTLPRYVFYGADFNHLLSKQDLGDIWQGTMPQIAMTPQEEEIIIEHELNIDEILGGYDIGNMQDIKLSIFKCKMRGHYDYYRDLVRESETPRQERDWYQYNWPYDYFSLVELLKVEGWEKTQFIDAATETAGSGDAPEESKAAEWKSAYDASNTYNSRNDQSPWKKDYL